MHATWVGALCAGLVLVAFTARAHATAGPRHRGVDVAFVLAGPLAKRCGLSCAADVPVARWASLADALSAVLGTPPDIYDVRVHQYYLPVYFWLRALLDARAAGSAPLCVGLQCVQGGGKTTLVNALVALFAADPAAPRRCLSASLDDFYFPREALVLIGLANAANPLLQVRGNPGTHDVALCAATLRALRAQRPGLAADAVRVPRFDKRAFGGRGDREPIESWSLVSDPVDVVLLEGWCLGFVAKADDAPLHAPELQPINAALRRFEAIYSQLDALAVVQVADARVVYAWREEAEARARAGGLGAMSGEDVVRFVDCYMPAYREYLPALYAAGPDSPGVFAGKPRLSFYIDAARAPCADAASAAGSDRGSMHG